MKSRARFSSVRVSGSDFVKTLKSRSRIFKQGSRRLGESRILPFTTPIAQNATAFRHFHSTELDDRKCE